MSEGPSRFVVLVVDDESLVRNVARAALRSAQVQVLIAEDGHDALRLSREFTETIHLLISDVKMPGLDGFQLAEQMLQERPGLRVLMMSGAVSDPHAARRSRLPFLTKPFTVTQLREEMWRVLASDPPKSSNI